MLTDDEIREAISKREGCEINIIQPCEVTAYRLGWEARGRKEAAGTNYIANDEVEATYVEFVNGRTVTIVNGVLAIGWRAEHTWVPATGLIRWPHCVVCGVIQRSDLSNSPCKGPTKLRAIARAGKDRAC